MPAVGGWLADLMALPGLREAPLDLRIATAASPLPGSLHNDPADRLIVGMARVLGVEVVTRDAAILAYGTAWFVGVVGHLGIQTVEAPHGHGHAAIRFRTVFPHKRPSTKKQPHPSTI